MKRLIDILLSLVGLVIVAILYPFVAIAIKRDSVGPVLFKTKRVSQGKIITIYKFRTMINGAHKEKLALKQFNERADGPFFKIKDDPRVTPVGRILRKFWLDETPQFWSVLKGDISLVGPRPYEPAEVDKYPPAYAFLKQAKSGITGLSQVEGSSNLHYEQVLRYDAFYVQHCSFWLDIKIIWRTFLMLFKPSGV